MSEHRLPNGDRVTVATIRAVEQERDDAMTDFQDTYADLVAARYELKHARSDRAEAQEALAASQADLTRMQQQRDELLEAVRSTAEMADRYLVALEATSRDLATARYQNRRLTAENESALRALTEQRSWQVARNDDAGDFRCGRPIVRSQALEPQPGTTKGLFGHVHCPTEES